MFGEEALLQISMPTATYKKLMKIKSLRSHKNPSMDYAELLEDMAEIVLKKIDPERVTVKKEREADSAKPKDADAEKASAPDTNSAHNPRYISQQLKAKIWQRDQGRCTFTNLGRRCQSTHLLQMDHIQPVQFGGVASEKNLRLLCQAHHQARK